MNIWSVDDKSGNIFYMLYMLKVVPWLMSSPQRCQYAWNLL